MIPNTVSERGDYKDSETVLGFEIRSGLGGENGGETQKTGFLD